MASRITMLLTAGLTIAVILASCGGESGDSASDSSEASGGQPVTTSELSKAAFVKRASAACIREGKGLSGQASAYVRKHGSENLPESVALANLVKAVVLPSIEAQSAAVRKLGVPAGDEQEFEAIFAAQDDGIERLSRLDRIESIKVVEDSFADFNKQLEDYGFTACIYG